MCGLHGQKLNRQVLLGAVGATAVPEKGGSTLVTPPPRCRPPFYLLTCHLQVTLHTSGLSFPQCSPYIFHTTCKLLPVCFQHREGGGGVKGTKQVMIGASAANRSAGRGEKVGDPHTWKRFSESRSFKRPIRQRGATVKWRSGRIPLIINIPGESLRYSRFWSVLIKHMLQWHSTEGALMTGSRDASPQLCLIGHNLSH